MCSVEAKRFAILECECICATSDGSQLFFDRPPAINFSFSLYTFSLRGCSTKMARVSSWGLVFSTANRLILMAALKSRITDSMRFLPLFRKTNPSSPRAPALFATAVSSSSRRATTFSHLSLRFFFSLIFVACSFSFDGRREEDFSILFMQPAMTALQDPQLDCPYFSLGIFMFKIERTSSWSAGNRENAFHSTHVGVIHN